MGLLYKLNFFNGKSYIGITELDSVDVRVSQHRYCANSGKDYPVYSAWRKHGEPSVEILSTLYGDDLYQAEVAAIKDYGTICPSGYNVLEGGQKSPSLNKHVARKISASTIARYKDPKQRAAQSIIASNMSPDTKLKISKALTGKKLSKETKEKIRAANLGKQHSKQTREKMSRSQTGKQYSELTKKNMSESAKKRASSDAGLARMSKVSMIGAKASMKKVLCINNGITYASASEAARELGLLVCSVSRVALGKSSHTKNYNFEYVE